MDTLVRLLKTFKQVKGKKNSLNPMTWGLVPGELPMQLPDLNRMALEKGSRRRYRLILW